MSFKPSPFFQKCSAKTHLFPLLVKINVFSRSISEKMCLVITHFFRNALRKRIFFYLPINYSTEFYEISKHNSQYNCQYFGKLKNLWPCNLFYSLWKTKNRNYLETMFWEKMCFRGARQNRLYVPSNEFKVTVKNNAKYYASSKTFSTKTKREF